MPRESLVSDIPAGDGKIINLFYSVLMRVSFYWGKNLQTVLLFVNFLYKDKPSFEHTVLITVIPD
jgi:hypothetical protein